MRYVNTRRVGAVLLCGWALFADRTSAGDVLRASNGRPRPGLIVLVAVDQLRADILDRCDAALTGGFRRLKSKGFRFVNTFVDHAPTTSMPGHATIATGMFPSHHGILEGSWGEMVDGKLAMTSSVRDGAYRIVGFPDVEGASPKKFLAAGLADWIRATDPKSEVVGLGGEYGPILHLAKARGQAYWYSPDIGRYVTSTFYADAYPAWVQTFNDVELKRMQEETTWRVSVPEKYRRLALPDDMKAEYDGVHTTFPHVLAAETSADDANQPAKLAEWFYFHPGVDEATLAVAQRAVEDRKLGRRGSTDLLTFHLGSLDAIGHRYGPRSLEHLDAVLRLDRALGRFFEYLDRKVGARNYLVAMTADHGVAEIPEEAARFGKKGRRVTLKELDEVFDEAQAYATAHPDAAPERNRAIAELVRKHPFVGGAITREDLKRSTETSGPVALFRNSYHPDRYLLTLGGTHGSLARFDLVAWLTEGSIPDYAPAVHGSPYLYDRTVPLIFMGTGVSAGHSRERARTVDVAPTLACLASVPVKVRTDGHALPVGGCGRTATK
jgi:predicted AlkP superfamily pyrophosphatase or phosphodiesterase